MRTSILPTYPLVETGSSPEIGGERRRSCASSLRPDLPSRVQTSGSGRAPGSDPADLPTSTYVDHPGLEDPPRPPAARLSPEGTPDLGLEQPGPEDEPGLPSPLRKQYLEIKQRTPGMLLLFQIGDFFETFDEDAHIVSRELDLTLTRKAFGKNDVHPLAGIPVRSVQTHLARLLQRGYKVALCEQVTLPGHGLVERAVTRIVTPGTLIEPGLLDGRRNNFLAVLIPSGAIAGLAYADVSTGEFRATHGRLEQLEEELSRLDPAELLLPAEILEPRMKIRSITRLDLSGLDLHRSRATLLDHFGVQSLDAFGCEGSPPTIVAAAALLLYLKETQPEALTNLIGLQRYHLHTTMQLDAQTIRNLELFQSWDLHGPTIRGSLIAILDQTRTPMGGRLIRRWLRHPLLDRLELERRLDAVEWFVVRDSMRTQMRELLHDGMDLERGISRIRRRLASPDEVRGLADVLAASLEIIKLLGRHHVSDWMTNGLEDCSDLILQIRRTLVSVSAEDPVPGSVIRAGVSSELDALRRQLEDGHRYLRELETRERARSGIRSLKVAYNKVFGYFLEVTRANLHLVPEDYLRKQTLSNGERYFTLELKEHESLMAHATERMAELEAALFRRLCETIGGQLERLRHVAASLARLDTWAALADLAVRQRYVRPVLEDSTRLILEQARHPMLECQDYVADFTPNDAILGGDTPRIMLLTAPNMAGKTVYLRQVALICLMAQVGSFVPARRACIGLVDRVFTRIGLHEYALRGQSSFMLEMIETAHILHHATSRSLILLDEVGRGTSTTDGLAIARAVLEYLHHHPALRARVLFATHYHELTAEALHLPAVANFHIEVDESEGMLRYLYRIKAGKSEKSFGIHVAKLAGIPNSVLRRAQYILEHDAGILPPDRHPRAPSDNWKLPDSLSEIATQTPRSVLLFLQDLGTLDVHNLTPIESLSKLHALTRSARTLLEALEEAPGPAPRPAR